VRSILKIRIDQLITDREIVDTRSKAKVLIEKSLVKVNGKITTKAGTKVSEDCEIEVLTDTFYVSRSAYKLESALKVFKINPSNYIAADIGSSTGGFTEILLAGGASKVYCVDVGHDQLNAKLISDERVTNIEGFNIKNPLEIEAVDIAVSDLSYISQRLVFHNIFSLVKESGELVILIKPQFEAGLQRMGKDAVLRDPIMRLEVLTEVLEWFYEKKYPLIGLAISPIEGKQGNVEYLAYFKKGEDGIDVSKLLEKL
jgi:23S rRNA (cytidine1920-2'-O)/16S rRNA (cytidine1409-2'-O)-methyltransferase